MIIEYVQQYLEEIKNGTSKMFPIVPNKVGNVEACMFSFEVGPE